jgi:hypothetical protein
VRASRAWCSVVLGGARARTNLNGSGVWMCYVLAESKSPLRAHIRLLGCSRSAWEGTARLSCHSWWVFLSLVISVCVVYFCTQLSLWQCRDHGVCSTDSATAGSTQYPGAGTLFPLPDVLPPPCASPITNRSRCFQVCGHRRVAQSRPITIHMVTSSSSYSRPVGFARFLAS